MQRHQFLNETYLDESFYDTNVWKLFDDTPSQGISLGKVHLNYKDYQFQKQKQYSIWKTKNNLYHYQISFNPNLLACSACKGNNDFYKWSQFCELQFRNQQFETQLGYLYLSKKFDISTKIIYSLNKLTRKSLHLNCYFKEPIKTNIHLEISDKIENIDVLTNLSDNLQIRLQRKQITQLQLSFVKLFQNFTLGFRATRYFDYFSQSYYLALAKKYNGLIFKFKGGYNGQVGQYEEQIQFLGVINESPLITINCFARLTRTFSYGLQFSLDCDLNELL